MRLSQRIMNDNLWNVAGNVLIIFLIFRKNFILRNEGEGKRHFTMRFLE